MHSTISEHANHRSGQRSGFKTTIVRLGVAAPLVYLTGYIATLPSVAALPREGVVAIGSMVTTLALLWALRPLIVRLSSWVEQSICQCGRTDGSVKLIQRGLK